MKLATYVTVNFHSARFEMIIFDHIGPWMKYKQSRSIEEKTRLKQ